MYGFNKLTTVNGINQESPISGRANHYCWSMSELDDYIYVGTARNMVQETFKIFLRAGFVMPVSLDSPDRESEGEIWRYKKDSSSNWERVFKAESPDEYGFRYMVNFKPVNGNEAIYAASAVTNSSMKIYKSVNGTVWKSVLSQDEESDKIIGTSSRAMVGHNGKLYLAAVNESSVGPKTLLYSSKDPEFYPWKLETTGTDPLKNPQGGIMNMEVFNNRIYVAVGSPNGIQVWRTNGSEPKVDDWKKVIDNGFGDENNKFSLSMGVFKNHLYISTAKDLPSAWLVPRGCDIVRIDENDEYEVVVGKNSISKTYSGFNNPFNIYAWQMKEYKGMLYVTTLDASTNMELILNLLLANKESLGTLPKQLNMPIDIDTAIKIYEIVVRLLNGLNYPFGFNLYVSKNGVNFFPVSLDGFDNRYNYGGRILYVDKENDLYVGTANPVQGLEVWKSNYNNSNYDYLSNANKLKFDYKEIIGQLEEELKQLHPNIIDIKSLFDK